MGNIDINLTDQAQGVVTGADRTFGGYLGSIVSVVMTVAAVLLLLYLIWGAIEWITSAGDNSKVQKARDKITQSIIGIIVLSATIAIFMFVQQFLGIELFTFTNNQPSDNGGGAVIRCAQAGQSIDLYGSCCDNLVVDSDGTTCRQRTTYERWFNR